MTQEEKLELLLNSHRDSFNKILGLSANAGIHTRLGYLHRLAAIGLSAVYFEEQNPTYGTHGSLGHWGENGHAPYIRSLLKEAKKLAS